jgi:PD-(D/E)XK nuclease superfamily
MSGRTQPLPPRTLDEVHEAFPKLRQSTMGQFDNCALSALFDLEGYAFTTSEQARGIIYHRFAGKVLKTLWETGNTTMPVAEALQILHEACAQRDVPDRDLVWVPTRERRLLRTAAIMLVWNPVERALRPFGVDRLIPDGIELRLDAPVRYPESRPCLACGGEGDCDRCGGWGRELTGAMVERVVTGQLDALLADPPDGMVVLDWKTTRKAPPRYEGEHRGERGRVDGSRVDAGLSYLGYWQQRTYGLSVLRNMPEYIYRVTLREVYPLDLNAQGNMEVRTSTITRDDLPRIEEELATVAELVDRGLMSGSDSNVWKPQPGVHCSFCRAPSRCPIEPEARGAGRITSKAEAERVGAEAIVAKQVLDHGKAALKEWVSVYGPVEAKWAKGRQCWRFKAPASGKGRGTFGVFVPEASDRGPEDPAVAGAFAEVKERQGATV